MNGQNKTSLPKPENRRRFPRIDMKAFEGELEEIVGAWLIWPNGESMPIYDMSYTGIAAKRPSQVKLTHGMVCQLQCKLLNSRGQEQICSVKAETVWFNDSVIGLHIVSLEVGDRSLMNDFLDDKVIGASMREIAPSLYARELDCDYWFHGPKDSNVYLWLKDGQLHRVEAEVDDIILQYQGAVLELGVGDSESGIQEQYYDDDEVNLTAAHGPLSRSQAVRRLIDIFSQMPQERDAVRQMLKILSDEYKRS